MSIGYISGGKLENFKGGWGVDVTTFGKAHLYRVNSYGIAVARCGKWIEERFVYGAGSFPKCKTCQKINGDKE
jgi:hypothetical protein